MEKKNGANSSKDDQALFDLLHEWDTDGDGRFTADDVFQIARAYKEKENNVTWFRRALIVGAVVVAVLLAAILAMSFLANELAKDFGPNKEGVLVTKDGHVATTASSRSIDGLDGLTQLNNAEFAGVERVSFSVSEGLAASFGIVGFDRQVDAVSLYFECNSPYSKMLIFEDAVDVVASNGTVFRVFDRVESRRLDGHYGYGGYSSHYGYGAIHGGSSGRYGYR